MESGKSWEGPSQQHFLNAFSFFLFLEHAEHTECWRCALRPRHVTAAEVTAEWGAPTLTHSRTLFAPEDTSLLVSAGFKVMHELLQVQRN